MEIDCLICGQIGMCTFANSIATFQGNNDGRNNQEKSKWSKCFCELLDVNTELVPEIQGILQFSYYCNHCIPDLEFIYETFCEIEALRESLNRKKDECKVKLINASLKCNGAERDHIIAPSRQCENVTTRSDDDDEDLIVPVEFDFHPSSHSPCQTLNRDKLLQCLQKDVGESRPLRLSQCHVNDEDQEEEPWILPSDTFGDEYYDPLENISVTQESLNTDLTESVPSPPELDLKIESENIDESQTQRCNIFEDKQDSQVENISVTPQTIEIPKPKRFQITIHKSTAKLIISNDVNDDQEPSTPVIRYQSKIQDYSETNPSSPNNSNFSADNLPKPKPESDSSSSKEENDSKDPEYNIKDDMPKNSKYKKRNNSERRKVFLPNVLSGQDTIKNIKLLEGKYDELIKYYGIKKLRIPVMKLPDDDSDSESEGTRMNCKCPMIDCKTRFYRKFKLIKHIKVVHRGMKYPYECKICHMKFTRKVEQKEHLNVHTNTFPFSCSECDHQSSTRRTLEHHQRSQHPGKKFQCDQCGLFCPTQRAYKSHLKRHSSERLFVCEVCGKSYRFPHDLRYHRTRHPELNLKQYKCEVCAKVFGQPSYLRQHMRSHTGNLPFLCDKCDYRAPTATVLRSHMNRHTEGRPFECEACHAKYKHPAALARHKKFECGTNKDSRNAVCSTCGKGFKTIIRLKCHEKLHKVVGRPFLCYICGSSYTANKHLRRHHQTCHKDIETERSCKNAVDDVSVNP